MTVMIDKNLLLELLEEWNALAAKSMVGLRLVALGGTALTLLDIKASTKDIDFTVPGEDLRAFNLILAKSGIKHAGGISYQTRTDIRLDVFRGGQIFTTSLPDDYVDKAILIRDFGNLKLYALSIYDIIITKLARNSAGDEEDIRSIFKAASVDIVKLKKRFREVQKLTLDNHLAYHFKRLVTVLLKEWAKAEQ